ncbi:MAG: methyltransferase domain-containing protein [Bacteroidota bacterium]
MTLDYIREFSSISEKAIKLDFLSKYLPEGDEIFVNPTTGFVTSSRKMSAEDVAAYWSNVIFPDKSIESYSANFPFAKARLTYVINTIVDFLSLDAKSKRKWCDFATGEGVLLQLISTFYPNIEVTGTEHSLELVKQLSNKGFSVEKLTLGTFIAENVGEESDISTLTWTLANAIDPLSCVKDIVLRTKMGGHVCIAESSRILVPFRKSLSDYLSLTNPADLHPSHLSANTLRCLMQLAGLEIVYTNRYFDSDVLLVIGKKVDYPVVPNYFDDQKSVVSFMKKWAEVSEYFETIRNES